MNNNRTFATNIRFSITALLAISTFLMQGTQSIDLSSSHTNNAWATIKSASNSLFSNKWFNYGLLGTTCVATAYALRYCYLYDQAFYKQQKQKTEHRINTFDTCLKKHKAHNINAITKEFLTIAKTANQAQLQTMCQEYNNLYVRYAEQQVASATKTPDALCQKINQIHRVCKNFKKQFTNISRDPLKSLFHPPLQQFAGPLQAAYNAMQRLGKYATTLNKKYAREYIYPALEQLRRDHDTLECNSFILPVKSLSNALDRCSLFWNAYNPTLHRNRNMTHQPLVRQNTADIFTRFWGIVSKIPHRWTSSTRKAVKDTHITAKNTRTAITDTLYLLLIPENLNNDDLTKLKEKVRECHAKSQYKNDALATKICNTIIALVNSELNNITAQTNTTSSYKPITE